MAQVSRNYKYADADMLQDADTMAAVYSRNETYFTGFNAVLFPAEFKTDFKAAIEAARAGLRDEVIIDEIAEKTARLDEIMQRCRQQYKLIKFLVERAFPGDDTIHNQFGFNNYEMAVRTHHRMRVFLELMYSPLRKYADKIAAAGGATDLAETTAALASELRLAKKEQREVIKYRPEQTDNRIMLLNAVWVRLMDIYSAARIIFKGNATRLALFAPGGISGSGERKEEKPVAETALANTGISE